MPLGFSRANRQPQRPSAEQIARAFVAEEVAPEIGIVIADEIAFLKATTGCVNPDGHVFAASCGSVACVHNCGRIVWL